MEKKLSSCIPYKDKMFVYCCFIFVLITLFQILCIIACIISPLVLSHSLWPMECKPPDSSVHGVVPARLLEWDIISFSRGSSRPRDQSHGSCISYIIGKFFTSEPPGKLPMYCCFLRASLVAQLVKNLPAMRETRFNPWVGKIPWRRERLPTPVFWPEEFHGLYGPWGHKESDATAWLHYQLSYSCHWMFVCMCVFVVTVLMSSSFNLNHKLQGLWVCLILISST